MMLLREFLIFTVVYLRLVSARVEYPDLKPRCHFETIPCPCERYGTAAKSVNVTLKVCNRLSHENQKSVCSGKAIVEKCRGAYLVQGFRERRNADSQFFSCDNGTVGPRSTSSPTAHLGPPNVTINGRSKVLNLGEHAVFQCTVVSTLPVTITWLFNGRPLRFLMNDSHYSHLECKKVLQVKLLRTSDEGNYTCVAKNELGQSNASSRLSIIGLKGKGPFIKYMGLQDDKNSMNTAVIGSTINITCEVHNTAVVTVFIKDGIMLKEGNGEHYVLHHTPYEREELKISNLEIKNVTFQDAGNYTCFAFLKGLRKNKSFHLRVVYPDTGDDLEQDGRSSPPPGTSTEYILGILFGVIIVAIIAVTVAYCFTKRRQRWSSLNQRTNSTRQLNLHTEVNGSCGNAANSQCLEVVRRPPEVDYEAKYDVFICYSFKDIAWVKELQTELETRHFICCIDFRDFVPGAPIVENIYQAIYHSRKTVAVLSPDFVNSEWCTHELQKALTRIRSHQVVPIVYRSCEIPLVLQDRTYLDWENCHVKPYFWEQLEKSLKQPNDNQRCLGNGGTIEVVVS